MQEHHQQGTHGETTQRPSAHFELFGILTLGVSCKYFLNGLKTEEDQNAWEMNVGVTSHTPRIYFS
jgi:hypothetical protein